MATAWMPRSTGFVDLVFGSPPYEDARPYNKGSRQAKLAGEEWVSWMLKLYSEYHTSHVYNGLMALVVNGRTKSFSYSCTPELLTADLKRAGQCVRSPLYYGRYGIPGSGGPDWLRRDVENIVCVSRSASRLPWANPLAMALPPKYPPGGSPSHRKQDGNRVERREYRPPKLANPGCVIHCKAGKGHMGSNLAHENQAPFPERLAEFMVRSFCPPRRDCA